MKYLDIVLSDTEYRTLMDVLWFVSHQREKIEDHYQAPIEHIRMLIKINTLSESDES